MAKASEVNKNPTEADITELEAAHSVVLRATDKVGKIRGNAGGWKNEGDYSAAYARLYSAYAPAGIGVTNRKVNGSYYILGSTD